MAGRFKDPPTCEAVMRRAQRVCGGSAYFVVRRRFLTVTSQRLCKRHVPWLTIANGQGTSYIDIREKPRAKFQRGKGQTK